MADDTDRYTYPPDEPAITTEAALELRLEAQFGGDWFGDSGALPSDDGVLAVYTAEPRSGAHVASLLAYIWTGPMRGEWWDQTPTEAIPDHLYLFSIDTTKSQRDDVPAAWDDHKAILSEGTPVRKTNKAGPGTAGTRAIAGLGPVLMAWRD